MADEDIYENMPMTEAAPHPKGNPPKTSVPWRHRAGGIVTAVLLLLSLALATSLLAVMLLYLQGQTKLQAVEEAVQKLQVSLQPDNASDASAKGSDSLQLLDEAQAGVRMLKAQLGNVSAAYGAIQIRLDNVSAAYGAIQIRLDNVSAARGAVQDGCNLRGQSKLQAVEEAVQKLQVSLQPDNASDASAKGSDSLQLLAEAQAGVRMLKAQLGNVSAAYGEIQIRLDNVSAARGAVQVGCSDVLTKLPRGWRFYGGNFYYFSQERKSWDKAERLCVSQDSHLTSVFSQVEQEFLSREIQGEAHWIGLTDRGTEGSWRWVDGTEYRADASRGFWAQNEPNNVNGGEDCVHTEPKKRNLWNDVNCTVPFKWICKQAHGQAGL